jgi:hypothetical protein
MLHHANYEQLADTMRGGINLLQRLTTTNGAACAQLLGELIQSARETCEQLVTPELMQLADETVELSWERLHHGPWKNVPSCWREAYSVAGTVKADLLYR